jgi:hypothetical protein
MISEHTARTAPARIALSGTWRAPVTGRAAVYRFTSMLSQWVRIPVLPYAALWEASLVAGQRGDRKTFAPDPPSTGMPCLTDSWLRR